MQRLTKFYNQMITTIVTVFILGYAAIALESSLKINKTAIALLLCVLCWVLYMTDCNTFVIQMHGPELGKFMQETHLTDTLQATHAFITEHILLTHLGDTCEIIFFLMGAMTIVETVDASGGFGFVKNKLSTRSKRALLWRIVFMTFFLSAILDNLTTSIVMIMVLRKLISNKEERLMYACMVILAANSGGAFSPIGDVTTIMLWIKGNITTQGVIQELLIPSLVSVIIPTLIVQTRLKGELSVQPEETVTGSSNYLSQAQKNTLFCIGVGGLIMVPVFRAFTGLPPFMGILLVLSLLWVTSELFYRNINEEIDSTMKQRVSDLLHKIDLSTILFFLGILMAVASLQETGVLSSFGKWLDNVSGHNAYWVTGVIGVVSSIVDNVPLVASCMGMYNVVPATVTDPALLNFVQDGIFWQLLAYCAGVGGSILIIGSAAGVVIMGLEKITFGWYLKNISWLAFVGYIAGIGTYWVEKLFM